MTTQTHSRAQLLKDATADIHNNVDKSIMAQDPFADEQSYVEFLTLQYYFLKDVAALYEHPALLVEIDDLPARRRLSMLEQDFADFDKRVPESNFSPVISKDSDFATALGWLYVVEGSKVGAAMLGKQVQARLGYTGDNKARYLAGPGAGRGSAWRHLIGLIDGFEMTEQQEQAMFDGARQAFTRFQLFQAQVYSWSIRSVISP